ncbi:MAG TPA: gliding motility-associated C-terminal domain-containing protein, partial [Panacibacter sp.]|nr:gliding motility-associated C-terminal domain-containing protein [Panacibacter sp.]
TCSASNGSITATATGGTAPFTYSIDGISFVNSNVFNGLAAGSYTVSVKDVNGCINSTVSVINNISAPTITGIASPATCNASNGVIIATPNGGTPPFSYSINGTSFQSGNSFTGLPAGAYTVTIKDANGCSNSTNININNSSGPSISATATAATCNGNNGSITAIAFGGAPPFTYSIDGIHFQQSAIFSTIPAGSYTISVKDANSCINSTAVTVNGGTGPSLSTTATASSCSINNGSISATALGGTTPFSYSIDGINFQTGNSFNTLAAGTYTITVKDANGCTAVSPVTVATINAVAVNAGNDITICEGTSSKIAASSDGSTFSWSPADGLSDPFQLNPYVSPKTNTTYVLTAHNGTCTKTDTLNVAVNPAPVPYAGPDTSVCPGNTLQLQGNNGMQYTWLPPAFLSNANAPNPYIIDLPGSITYYLSVIDANGCRSLRSDTIHITLMPPPKVFAGNDTSIAMGQPVQLNAIDVNNTGFTTYTWAPPYKLSDAHIQNPVTTTDKETVYAVTATTPQHCTATDYISIRVYRGPDIYVPTGFTPNGDGLNDVERAIPVGIKEFKFFNIYSRYGELVFTTADPSRGWDGYYKGVRQAPGTYVWQTEGIGYDGKVIFRKGTVVLIR